MDTTSSSQHFSTSAPAKSSDIQRGRLLCNWKLALLLAVLILASSVLAVIIVLSLPGSLPENELIDKTQPHQDGAMPQDKLTNLLSEQDNIHCNPHPELHQVLLSELCQIHYPSNSTTVRSFFYSTAHCPNCLCKGTNEVCSETRCCCRPTETTNLTYTCPSYLGGESVLVSDIPTKCGCQPCGEMQVSVIIRVLKGHSEPIVLANITIDGVQSYQSDEQGYVGFMVPASQAKVNVTVRALLFREFQRHYFIIPGRVNSITIHLQASRTVTLIPPQAPFIISFTTLKIETAQSSVNFDYLEIDQLIDVMDLLDKFNPKFGEVFAYFPAKVFPRDKQFTFTTSVPQTLYEDLTQELLDISFLLKRQKKFAGAYHDIPLFALGWGQLEIYDEDGRPFDPLTLSTPFSEEHYSILLGLNPLISQSLSQTKLNNLRLYSYDDGSKVFKILKERPYMYKNHASEIQWAVFPIYSTLPSFPLNLAIAVEEQHACYLATRANDPLQLINSNTTQATTMVQAVARLGGTNSSSSEDYLVFINRGEINSCITVPCHGELALHVMDNSKLQTNYGMSIVDHYERYNSNFGHVGPVYKSRRGCEAIGLESKLDSSDHIVLELTIATMNRTIEEDVEQKNFIARTMARGMQLAEAAKGASEDPEFCSVKVSIRMCLESTIAVTCIAGGEIMTKSLSSEESTAAIGNGDDPGDLEWASGDSDDDWLNGPANGQNRYQSKCNRLQHACFTFSCESQVNLSVVSMTDSSDILNVYHDVAFDLLAKSENDSAPAMQYNSVPCLPRSNFHSPNLDSSFKTDSNLLLLNIAAYDSGQFVFESTSSRERGVFRSLNTKEVAQQKCTDSGPSDVGVHFDCAPSN